MLVHAVWFFCTNEIIKNHISKHYFEGVARTEASMIQFFQKDSLSLAKSVTNCKCLRYPNFLTNLNENIFEIWTCNCQNRTNPSTGKAVNPTGTTAIPECKIQLQVSPRCFANKCLAVGVNTGVLKERDWMHLTTDTEHNSNSKYSKTKEMIS